MRRTLTLAAAALIGATLIAGTAQAQTPGGYYVATPATQPAKSTLITRSTPWALRGNSYVAARAPERDAILCELVARKTGQLSGFSVGGAPFDADKLAKCNGVAKNMGVPAVAAR